MSDGACPRARPASEQAITKRQVESPRIAARSVQGSEEPAGGGSLKSDPAAVRVDVCGRGAARGILGYALRYAGSTAMIRDVTGATITTPSSMMTMRSWRKRGKIRTTSAGTGASLTVRGITVPTATSTSTFLTRGILRLRQHPVADLPTLLLVEVDPGVDVCVHIRVCVG